MVIKNITAKQLNEAVTELNTLYNSNIRLNGHKVLNNKDTRHRVTLRVNDCRGNGSRHGFCQNKDGEYRRTNSACWHTHGDFFDMLFKRNEKCTIRSNGNLITSNIFNSIMYPMYFSEMCEC